MKTWKGEPVVYATDKYDGHGMVLEKSVDGISLLCSAKRSWAPIENQFFCNFAKYAPNDTKIHVEVYVEGGEATDVIHYLTRMKPLSMRVTGIETWGGRDQTLAGMETIDGLCHICGLQAAQWSLWYTNVDYTALAIKRKLEGFVFKSCSYVPDRMYKVKPVLTVDLIISGFIDGKGKYVNKVGAIRCIDGEGKEVCTVSGMTDKIRFSLCAADEGRVVEVAYQKVTRDKRLRHPRFKRFRDDKNLMQVDVIH